MTECHLSEMSQQTSTATNQASVMHAIIHAWYMSGVILRSVYIAIADSGPRGLRYIGALLYLCYGYFDCQYSIVEKSPQEGSKMGGYALDLNNLKQNLEL